MLDVLQLILTLICVAATGALIALAFI